MDLVDLDPRTRALLEAMIDEGEGTVVRAGEPVGTLTFKPHVVSGTVIPLDRHRDAAERAERSDVTVVVTTMQLSDEARARLSASFGPDYLVVDYGSAPETADIVLTNPVSPQLIGLLAGQFPDAQVIVTEILDAELGIDVNGPVGRLIDAGARAYLPPRPVEQVAENVHGYLQSEGRGELGPGSGPAPHQIHGGRTD
ncbi:hypothetical protein VV01_02150 [Luteipulveratus halotolerans]|uniref:Uncharacterized protein n=1 Tax=Luteipulveratus halotolerans TaxID=1631356 RepID=A0A0L6CN25_9MICO|nr:hypothetical protein VV01_02150 [Luteipulveratus halotolerans]